MQHIIREQLDRRNASPADDFALLLNRIAPERLRLKAIFQRIGDEVDKMEDRLGRLDAAREVLALRQAQTAANASRENPAKRNGPQAFDITQNREMTDSPPPMIPEA